MTQKVTKKRRGRRSRTARPVELFTDLPVEKDSRGTLDTIRSGGTLRVSSPLPCHLFSGGRSYQIASLPVE